MIDNLERFSQRKIGSQRKRDLETLTHLKMANVHKLWAKSEAQKIYFKAET